MTAKIERNAREGGDMMMETTFAKAFSDWCIATDVAVGDEEFVPALRLALRNFARKSKIKPTPEALS